MPDVEQADAVSDAAAGLDSGPVDAGAVDGSGPDADRADGGLDAGGCDGGGSDAGAPDGGVGSITRPAIGGCLATGDSHTCHVRADGTLWCRGDGDAGQRGDRATVPTGDAVRVGTFADWTVVSADADATCEIRSGSLHGWGAGVATPVRIGSESDWVWVSVGDDHKSALRADTSLWCCGDNVSGELGLGGVGDRTSPTMVSMEWKLVRAGDDFRDRHTRPRDTARRRRKSDHRRRS